MLKAVISKLIDLLKNRKVGQAKKWAKNYCCQWGKHYHH